MTHNYHVLLFENNFRGSMTEQVNRCKTIAINGEETLKGMKHPSWSKKHYSLTYAPPPFISLRVFDNSNQLWGPITMDQITSYVIHILKALSMPFNMVPPWIVHCICKKIVQI